MKNRHFIDRLLSAVNEKKSHVVVGLDPDVTKIPNYLREEAAKKFGSGLKGMAWAIREFSKLIIDEVCDIVSAVKPQIAFYESYGTFGFRAFSDTLRYAKKKDLMVIVDAKRNDIGSTAQAYSAAHIGRTVNQQGKSLRVFDLDAITLNPYLGTDGIIPFIKDAKTFGKGVFVLVKTSNPSSSEIQDLVVDKGHGDRRKLYEIVGELVENWGADYVNEHGYSFVGAVVGATFPSEASVLRKVMPHSYFLVPGYGAQGAQAKDIVACFNDDGLGALVAASRSIIYAYLQVRDDEGGVDERSFARFARLATIRMTDDINEALRSVGQLAW